MIESIRITSGFVFALVLGLLPASLVGQIKPLGRTTATHAVVIGISDYQDKDIPDLRFAHKDAEAFALWLQSPAGGSLDGDQLQVLINDKATAGRVAEALDALLERVQENDKVFIYFSGHGDVERKTLSQPGFLLCWDAPSRVYMGGGTYSLAYLQEVVATLSVQNKAKVTVIADACRAGKLAGSQIGGPQLTSANLQRQQANELKILSCQAQEYSLEGTQWGGGRGVFSYHLMDGLYGLADRNADGVVTLGELDRYLEDHVTSQAAPISQVPVLLGNKTDGIAITHEKTLADLNRIKSGEMVYLAATDSRGLEDEVLAKLDSGIVEQYMAFKEAVLAKRFFPDTMTVNVKPTADELYTMLIAEPGLSPLFGAMTRNYAAALQDEAQRYFKAIFHEERWLDYYGFEGKKAKFTPYPRLLEKAAQLLGPDHYMYKPLMERMYIMEAYIFQLKGFKDKVIENLLLSMKFNSESAIAFSMMSRAYLGISNQEDSVIFYASKALVQAPNWYPPMETLSYFHNDSSRLNYIFNLLENNIDRGYNTTDKVKAACLYRDFVTNKESFMPAESLYLKILDLEPDYIRGYRQLALMYMRMRRYKDAERMYMMDSTNLSMLDGLTEVYSHSVSEKFDLMRCLEISLKMVSLDSTSFLNWHNVGSTYLDLNNYDESNKAFNKAYSLDSFSCILLSQMAKLYVATNQYSKAELFYKKAIKMDHINSRYWLGLGNTYIKMKRYDDAEQIFLNNIANDSAIISKWNGRGVTNIHTKRNDISSWISLGYLYLHAQRFEESESVFIKAIDLDSMHAVPRKHLGMVCFRTNRPEEARQNFLKSIELNPNYAGAMLGMAYLLSADMSAGDSSKEKGKTEEAIAYVEQAIGRGSTFEQLEKDEDLAPLRASPEWEALMTKHFPDKMNDE